MFKRFFTRSLFLVVGVIFLPLLHAEDGYRLWLRYDRIDDDALRQSYISHIAEIEISSSSPTLAAAHDELVAGLNGLLGRDTPIVDHSSQDHALLVGTPTSCPQLNELNLSADLSKLGEEGYLIRTVQTGGQQRLVIAANKDLGVLYGVFAFLRQLQTHQSIEQVALASSPKVQRRLLDHWDNLNRTVERGYAGGSLWEWFELPDYVTPRYRDYARANASIGINGAVLNNVNAQPLILTPPYLVKIAALADALRPYGIRVYLSVRFSSPVEIGGLKTADPFDSAVKEWWKNKTDEIYRYVPDFGGFLVKANSEGEPGPQNYGRNHADGANLLAEVIAPHGGIVMWRAFVYDQKVKDDRAKQAYNEFHPLDGKFLPNVVVQIKNGPIDFMPREAVHPLFGAMPKTSLALELQITQEYLGCDTQLVFLAPLYKECLATDTFGEGAGSTVGRIVDGSLDHHSLSVIAGIANTGTDRNWTGHPMAQANWYAFGRLSWDHELTSDAIAEEWTRMTYSNRPAVLSTIKPILLSSRETAVNYSMPLGLHHIMARDHHYGPGPWVAGGPRPDWTAPYYHRADEKGLGFDRTATGSNALGQYTPEFSQRFSDLSTCPDEFLLWFHHVPWDYKMRSGRTMWDDLCLRYQTGLDEVRSWRKSWDSLSSSIDPERFNHVKALLGRQEKDAREWHDACILYFQTFSHRPIPAGVEKPEHTLDYYENIKLHFVPGSAEANGRG